MSNVANVVKSLSTPIHLLRCKDAEQRDCYFFIMCTAHKAQVLVETLRTTSLDIRDYAKIIVSGFGQHPSEEVLRQLKQEFNFDARELLN